MNLPRIVGINGLKRSGKDTIGARLVAEGYKKVSFAAPLYEAMNVLDPWIPGRMKGQAPIRLSVLVDNYGWEEIKNDPDYKEECRRLLEVMGDEVGRQMFGQNCWVDKAMAKMTDETQRYVFTDMRYVNEFKAIAAYRPDAYLLKVLRPGTFSNGHGSDQDMPNHLFDGSIMNDDTIDSLHTRTLEMLQVGR